MQILGADTGGTFTDLVLYERGTIRVHKVPSTPDDPSRAVLAGIEALGAKADAEIRHGSTVGTNALLERKGARTALITTRGFRDVIEIGRQTRPSLYDIDVERPPAIVARRHRYDVAERVTVGGEVLEILDEAELPRLAERLRKAGIESVAIGLLFSFANPRHERRIARVLRAEGLRVPMSLSSQVSPEYREFERFSTTAVNAYLAPVMKRYLERLRSRVRRQLRIMQSNGGLASTRRAIDRPVTTVLSGPAAGVVGATRVAGAAGHPRIITFDMGGTSTDVALVDGEPSMTTDFQISGCPIRVPVLDIHTVGAGGGSIAYRDAGGALRVGPESAGADPGPACYGKGELPTVTDAQAVLGRIQPDGLLGGAMSIDPQRARRAVGTLAAELGTDLLTTAEGIIRVALAAMERAVKVISLERGHDPRDYTLLSFGGAGGLHAVELARQLGMTTVLVPRDPGALSALGLGLADAVADRSRSLLISSVAPRGADLERPFRQLEKDARAELRREGIDDARIRLQRTLSLRYRGQAHELDLDYRKGDLAAAFHRAHEDRFGLAFVGREIDVVSIRVRAVGRIGRKPGGGSVARPRAHRPRPATTLRLAADGKQREVGRFDRDALKPGATIAGAAIITEYSSTVWLPPGSRARVDAAGNLIVDAAVGKE